MKETGVKNLTRKEQAGVAFNAYLSDVAELGIVGGVLVGSRTDGSTGAFVWNVFDQHYEMEDFADERFVKLNKLTSQLKKGLPKRISTHIAHLNPEHLDEIRRECDERGIETTLVPIGLPQ